MSRVLVEIYRNLHKKQLSVRDPVARKVVGHVDSAVLLDAQFRVSEAGRQRVLKYKRKNVHAVVRGLMTGPTSGPPAGWDRIRYDPYATPFFVWTDTGEPIHHARAVYIGPEGVFAERSPDAG
jgi:hypothetical protein